MGDGESVSRLMSHGRELWGERWWVPGGLVSAYWSVLAVIGGLRIEHVLLGIVVWVFAYSTRWSRSFFLEMLPYIAVGVGYDSVRYLRPVAVTVDRVIGCWLRDVDALFFPGPRGLSLQEWMVQHHTPTLDLLASAPYAVFAYVSFVYAAYLYFVDRPRARRYLWAFAIANYIAFAMWLIVPAAAPWYVREYGCAIDLSVAPSPAALLRVDEYLGIDYFKGFYARTTSVFGALPSMHNAYPCLGLLTAWSSVTWRTKPLHILYMLWMFLGSMYLDHHWLVDALAGWVVALIAVRLAAHMLLYAERVSSLRA